MILPNSEEEESAIGDRVSMVKAKEIKLLRKALDQLHKSNVDPFDEVLLSRTQTSDETINSSTSGGSATTTGTTTGTGSCNTSDSNGMEVGVVEGNSKLNAFIAPAAHCSVMETTSTNVGTGNGTADTDTDADDKQQKKSALIGLPLLPVATPNKDIANLSISSSEPSEQKPNVYRYSVRYHRTLPNHILQQCLQLFTSNMKTLYEASSWGYDIESKHQELNHPLARFIVVTTSSVRGVNYTTPSSSGLTHDYRNETVVAFVHYRHCYDDDDDPTMIVLYIYEMQVHSHHQKQGIGQYLMSLIETIATQQNGSTTTTTASSTANANAKKSNVTNSSTGSKKTTFGNKKKPATISTSAVIQPQHVNVGSVQKIMLTVFRTNKLAIQFYISKLNFIVDPSSPSQYNQITDYEILSKQVRVL